MGQRVLGRGTAQVKALRQEQPQPQKNKRNLCGWSRGSQEDTTGDEVREVLGAQIHRDEVLKYFSPTLQKNFGNDVFSHSFHVYTQLSLYVINYNIYK